MSPYEALTDATQTPPMTDPFGPPAAQSFARIAYRQLVRNKLAMFGFALIFVVATIAVWVPFLANDKPYIIYTAIPDEYEEAYFSMLDAAEWAAPITDAVRNATGRLPDDFFDRTLSIFSNIRRMKTQLSEQDQARLNEIAKAFDTNISGGGTLDMWRKDIAVFKQQFGPDVVKLRPHYHLPLIRSLRPIEIFFIILWFAAVAQWFLRKREPVTWPRAYRTALLAAVVALTWGVMVPEQAVPEGFFKRLVVDENTFAYFPPVPYGETEGILEDMKEPPTWWPTLAPAQRADGFYHLLGTDTIGRDIFSRMIYGARIAMIIGFVAVSIYVTLGIIIGAVAGYFRGVTDIVVSRFIEIVICFPTLFLILIVLAYLRPSIINIMIVIGLTSWTGVARLTRGEFFRLVNMDYVNAIQALGGSSLRIIFRHILPNGIGPVLVVASFGIASAILIESALSFLGLGVPPPHASWGTILNDGRSDIPGAWWLTVFPGIAIFLTVTAWNLFGEGLRDAIDPRLKQ